MTEPTNPTPAAEALVARVVALATARKDLDALKAKLALERAAFDARHADTIATIKAEATYVAELETALKADALALHAITKATKPAPGVEVKSYKVVDIGPGALEWARKSNVALVPESLDVKALEKIAKATPLPPEVATVREEPGVTLASDLDAALTKAGHSRALAPFTLRTSEAMPPDVVVIAADSAFGTPDKYAEALAANRVAFAAMKRALDTTAPAPDTHIPAHPAPDASTTGE